MHSHSHDDDSSTRIGWAFFLNAEFTIIEFMGGVLTNSTAISKRNNPSWAATLKRSASSLARKQVTSFN